MVVGCGSTGEHAVATRARTAGGSGKYKHTGIHMKLPHRQASKVRYRKRCMAAVNAMARAAQQQMVLRAYKVICRKAAAKANAGKRAR